MDIKNEINSMIVPGYIRPAKSTTEKIPLADNVKIKVFFTAKAYLLVQNTYGMFLRKAQEEEIANIISKIICIGYGTNTHTVELNDLVFISHDSMVADTDKKSNTTIYNDYASYIKDNMKPETQLFTDITIAFDFIVNQFAIKEIIPGGGNEIMDSYRQAIEKAKAKEADKASESESNIISINKNI